MRETLVLGASRTVDRTRARSAALPWSDTDHRAAGAPLTDRMHEQVAATAGQLLHYCRSRNWAGIDPYDALNSRLFGEGFGDRTVA